MSTQLCPIAQPEERSPSSRFKQLSSTFGDPHLRRLRSCGSVGSRSVCWHNDSVCSRFGKALFHINYDGSNKSTNPPRSVEHYNFCNWRWTREISDTVPVGHPYSPRNSRSLSNGPRDSSSRQYCLDQCDCRELWIRVRGFRDTSLCKHYLGGQALLSQIRGVSYLFGSTDMEYDGILARNIHDAGNGASSSRPTQSTRR